MFQETTETFGKPQLIPPFLTYTNSLNLYPRYSYTRFEPGTGIKSWYSYTWYKLILVSYSTNFIPGL